MNKRKTDQLSRCSATFAWDMRAAGRSDRNPSPPRTGFGGKGTNNAQLVREGFYE
jgi:hypothetical protein